MKRRLSVLLLVVIIALMSAAPAFASHQAGVAGKPPHPEIHQHRVALSAYPGNSAPVFLLTAFALVAILLLTHAISTRKNNGL